VHADDNEYGLLWSDLEDIQIYDLETVVDCILSEYSFTNYFDYLYREDKCITDFLKIIPDVEYSKKFNEIDIRKTFPQSCLELLEIYDKYLKEYKNMLKQKVDIRAKEFEENYNNRNNIIKKIKSKILKILKLNWKDEKFHMITIENNCWDGLYDILQCENKIDIFKNRIDNIEKPLKFYHAL
jgi:hypothetical protein